MSTSQPDQTWKNLLARSASTFSAESEVPFGMATSTLALLRAEGKGRREMERIGWRAVIASMGALSIAAALTVAFDLRGQPSDADSGVPSVVQVEDLPIS